MLPTESRIFGDRKGGKKKKKKHTGVFQMPELLESKAICVVALATSSCGILDKQNKHKQRASDAERALRGV